MIGDVKLGEGSSLWHGVVVRGDTAAVSIGKNSVSLTRAPDMQQSSWHEKGSRGMLCI